MLLNEEGALLKLCSLNTIIKLTSMVFAYQRQLKKPMR
jgi:hypothetical protein